MNSVIELNPKDTNATTESYKYVIESQTPNNNKLYLIAKRIFDFTLAFLALTLLSLLMLIIALLIKTTSIGPVFFRQERLGKNGKKFMMYKFRTMHINAEADGPQWAKPNDERCTKIGKFLRKSRLDELPQFINIIKGDMSFVGPRPERLCFYQEFETYIHGFSNRLAVTPGLTGLAQVNGGYDLKPEEKIIYDMEYIKNQSLRLDIKLIFSTIAVVLTSHGAR